MRAVLVLLCLICVGAAGYLVFMGLQTAFDGESYRARIVGGDAYNYIIAGARGTALVGAGIASAAVAIVCAVLARLAPQ